MTKFYEVSKVLDKRTDAYDRVQFLVRWRGYGKRYDCWVDEVNTNERLRQVYRTRHQGNPGLLQTLAVLIAEKLNMKKPPTTSIVRRASVAFLESIPRKTSTLNRFEWSSRQNSKIFSNPQTFSFRIMGRILTEWGLEVQF